MVTNKSVSQELEGRLCGVESSTLRDGSSVGFPSMSAET